jgi:hypothetical protein
MKSSQCKKCGRLKSKTKEHVCPDTSWNKGKKGLQSAWNKGKKSSEETKKRLSNTRKEKILSGEIKRPTGKDNGMYGKTPWNKGKKITSVSPLKGKKRSVELRSKISGENHYNWKGGVGSVNTRIRKSYEYRQWVQDIFKRDDYTCQECFVRGGKLEAHHIKPFSKIIKDNNITSIEQGLDCFELWNFENGVTLCKSCHKNTDTYLKKVL